MKKRKELNALIGLGDSKRKKTKKGSGHRLLRTEPPDSESESSSEDDEYNNLNSVTAFGKRSYERCCSVCYPLCVFIILAACVMACAGLIWMQIALKEDLDSLKEKLRTMESSQKVNFHEIPKFNEDLKAKQRKLEDLENGDRGLKRLWSNLTEINKKLSALDSAVNHLKANIKSASDLITLPTTVEELQKSVATIGSTLTSVQHDVAMIQSIVEDQKKEEDGPKSAMGHGGRKSGSLDSPDNKPTGSDNRQDILDLQEGISFINSTQIFQHSWTSDQIHSLCSTLSNLTERVSVLEQISSPGMMAHNSKANVSVQKANLDNRNDNPVVKEENLTSFEGSKKSSASLPTRRPRFLSQTLSKKKRAAAKNSFSFPGVSSIKDLEDLFQHKGLDQASRGISYEELGEIFGPSIPDARVLEAYDLNGDQKYSLAELRAAAAL